MSVTISDGATSLQPLLVIGHQVSRESRNVVHKILGRPDPDITLREAGLRSGSLAILCATPADAYTMLAIHSNPGALTLTDTELPQASMQYVLAEGTAELVVDEQTQLRTVVSVPFQEVAL